MIENPTDFAKGANHYYAKYIDPPSWATEDTFVAEIGSHRFYRR